MTFTTSADDSMLSFFSLFQAEKKPHLLYSINCQHLCAPTLSVKTTPSFQMWYLVSIELNLFIGRGQNKTRVRLFLVTAGRRKSFSIHNSTALK